MLILALALAAFPLPIEPLADRSVRERGAELIYDDDVGVLFWNATATTTEIYEDPGIVYEDPGIVYEAGVGTYVSYGPASVTEVNDLKYYDYVYVNGPWNVRVVNGAVSFHYEWKPIVDVSYTNPFIPLAPTATNFAFLSFLFFWSFVFRGLSRALRMSETPAPTPPPDGLLDEAMTKIFGRSWRTGITGFLGLAATIGALFASVEQPYTWQKIIPLMPGLITSLGLMNAKDAKVSHTQNAPKS